MTSASSPSSFELLASSSHGDMDSFSMLFERYSTKLYNYAYYLTYSSEDAEDIASEAFVCVYEAIQGRDMTSFNLQAYLYKTARNLALRVLERQSREGLSMEEAPEIPEPDVTTQPETAVLIGEQRRNVRNMTGLLSEQQQTALLLKELEEFPYAMIAGVLDSNPNAVGALLARARLKFREAYRMAQIPVEALPRECLTITPILSKLIDGEASPEDEQLANVHLASCPACRENMASMQEASATYRSLLPLLPLATLKVWGGVKTALTGGKGAVTVAQVAGAHAGTTTAPAAGGGAMSAGAAATAATTAGTAAGLGVLTKIMIVAATVLVLGGAGAGGYFALKATVFAKKTVPTLTGMKEQETTKKATDAGLKVSFTYSDKIRTGNEVGASQDKTAGTKVEGGTIAKVTMADKAVADSRSQAQKKIVEANGVLSDAKSKGIVTTEYDPTMQNAQAKFSNAASINDYVGQEGAVSLAQSAIDACNQKLAAWNAAQQKAQETQRQEEAARNVMLADARKTVFEVSSVWLENFRMKPDYSIAEAVVHFTQIPSVNNPTGTDTQPYWVQVQKRDGVWVVTYAGTGLNGDPGYVAW